MVGAESEHDLQAQQDVEALTLQIEDPLNVALFLDLDGTVLDIAAAPRDVSTPIGLTSTLRRLQRTRRCDRYPHGPENGRGRSPTFALKVAGAGVHGGELRFAPEGRIEVDRRPGSGGAGCGLERLARSIPGVVVEHKGIAVALHYRAVPAMKPVLEKELQGLLDTHTNRLVLSHGRRVFELAPASRRRERLWRGSCSFRASKAAGRS